MSLVGDALAAMRDFVVLAENVERIGGLVDGLVDGLALEVREHDRRPVRLETMVEIAGARPRPPPSLPSGDARSCAPAGAADRSRV